MGISVAPGQMERFIGIFYKVNAKRPQPRPTSLGNVVVTQMVLTKGMMRVTTDNGEFDVNILPPEQVDQETYESFLSLLVNQFVEMFSLYQHTHQITEAMRNAGVIMRNDGFTTVVNPLTHGQGELDQFTP